MRWAPASRTVLLILAIVLALTPESHARGRLGEVLITVLKDKLVAVARTGRAVEEGLGLNETVMKTDSERLTGFAYTSNRLLGFSTELRRWTDVPLAVNERVERHVILPRLIVAHTDRQFYGFQEGRAHWSSEALGTRETVKQLRGRGHVVVAITSERALGFSSYTGGFFSIPLSNDERVISLDATIDAIMVLTSSRRLVFASQTTEWEELK
jgi:hypothetical protein